MNSESSFLTLKSESESVSAESSDENIDEYTNESECSTLHELEQNESFVVSGVFRKRYLQSMNQNSQVHLRKFKMNDRVLLKLDFDNNTKTRKKLFQGYFEETSYIIVEKYENGTYKLRRDDGFEKIVCGSRLKSF